MSLISLEERDGEMNYKKLFSAYTWRLKGEAALKALLTGAVCGLLVGTVLTVYSRIAIRECGMGKAFLVSLIVALIVAVPAYFVFRPNVKKTAARVDETGQHDRMATMLALREDDSFIASVQRQDALERLKTVKPERIPMKIGLKPLAAVGALVVALCIATMLPYRQLKVVAEEPIPEEVVAESRIIVNLIAQLREIVKAAPVSDELKVELNAVVNKLEATVDDYDTTLEKTARITETRSEIVAIIERETATTDIADVLLADEELKDLGKAIADGGEAALHTAVEALREEMLEVPADEREAWFTDMANRLNEAIEAAGGIDKEFPDPILQALKKLADQFSEAAALFAGDTVPEDAKDRSNLLGGIGLSDTEDALGTAAEEKTAVGEALQPLLDALGAAQNDLFGITPEETQEEEETPPAEGETPGEQETEPGDDPEDPSGGGEGGGSGGEGGGGGEEDTPEGFFDPTQEQNFGGDDYELTDEDFERGEYGQNVVGGNVPYSDVYLDYYASALQDIARANIPDSLKNVIISYFTSLD